jgi:predicted ATPase with chaperone activity
MEPLTLLATGATIVLAGALTRVGELSLDGAIAQLKNLIVVKSPEIWKQLEATAKNPAALPKTIEVMATLLEDQELREVAEQVTKENESNPYVIQMINQNKQVTVSQSGIGNSQNNTFSL